jgi:hypothetical protein
MPYLSKINSEHVRSIALPVIHLFDINTETLEIKSGTKSKVYI